MGLDEPDGAWRDPRLLVGTPQGQFLTVYPGCHHAQGSPIARHTHPFDNGVDAIAIPLSVFKSLQDRHPQALAQDRSVSVLIKGPDSLAQ